jgi:CDP-4-dehydro-6-deoxyglucose reductase, E1
MLSLKSSFGTIAKTSKFGLVFILEKEAKTTSIIPLLSTEKRTFDYPNEVCIKPSDLMKATIKKKMIMNLKDQIIIKTGLLEVLEEINSEKKMNISRQLVIFHSKRFYQNKKELNIRNNYIPVSGKVLDEEDLFGLIDASLDMHLTTGRFNDQFENQFAKYLDIKYACTTNSGSSANLLAIAALKSSKLKKRQLHDGDEVITVAACFPTTVAPILQNGLVPVFVDVELNSYNIDVSQIEPAITSKTKAIFVAHTLGNPFNLEAVLKIAKKYNLWIIEDNCDALGSKYNGQNTGTLGHIGTFSFYPAHHMTMGEGGALVTNDHQLYRIIMSLRDWGRDCWCPPGQDDTCKRRFTQQFGTLPLGYDHKYVYSHFGYNLKITDWQAAIGLSQLKKLPKYIKKRKDNFEKLSQRLKLHEKYFILPKKTKNSDPSWFGFLLSLKENAPFSKVDFVKYLEENKIGTRQLFAGNILRQPLFLEHDVNFRVGNSKLLNTKKLNQKTYPLLPCTDYIMNNTFWIGVWPGIDKKDIEQIGKAFDNFVAQYT